MYVLLQIFTGGKPYPLKVGPFLEISQRQLEENLVSGVGYQTGSCSME